jgi:glycosyltransferase involved in cell wall biosynthesis
MSVPRVTVVIPTYNRAHYLCEAIQSALNQSYTDFEIVVADNASTDNTAEVVAGFKDPRIRYYRHHTNIGMTLNWQFTFSQASTEFVAALPDDDLHLPDHLATAIEALDKHPAAAYYTCLAEYFGRDIGSRYYRPRAITDTTTPLVYIAPEQAINFLGTDPPGPMNDMVCRKAALRSLFWGKPDYIPQDLLVLPQLMVQGGFVFGNRATARYRVHEANASINPQRKAILRFNLMVWYGVRWLAQFLLGKKICTLADIEAHGRYSAEREYHVVPLVLALGSFESPAPLRAIARRVFQARTDADPISARFRLARRLGFWVVPVAEKITQVQVGWRP